MLWIAVIFAGLLCSFSVMAKSAAQTRAGRILEQVKQHLRNYPLANYEDAYKFIHQAALGPGHLGAQWDGLDRYLRSEWESLERDSALTCSPAGMPAPMVEDLGGAFVRVNLVCYGEAGGTLDDLSQALRNSLDTAPDSTLLLEVWYQATGWLLAETDTDPDSLAAFNNLLRAHDWPAVHHSVDYKDAYAPHYRVLERSNAEQLLENLSQDTMQTENGMPVSVEGGEVIQRTSIASP